MLGGVADAPALWGALGCFIFAGPRLSVCVFTPHAERCSAARCMGEFVIAMLVGTTFAAVFGPWGQELLRAGSEGSRNGVAGMMGLVANTTAPKLTDSLSAAINGLFSGRVGRSLKGEEKP